MTGRRRPRLGIRGRVLAVLTAAILTTLATATVVMLPLLHTRLDADRIGALRSLVRTARPTLQAVPEGAMVRHSPQLLALVDSLQERAGGRIAIYDVRGPVLADTAERRPRPAIEHLARYTAQARRHRDGVFAGKEAGVAFAVAVTRAGGKRVAIVITRRLDDTRAAAVVLGDALPIAALAAITVALILGLALSRGLIRRLTQLHADAHALGDEGLGHVISVDGDDEIAEVAAALEEMRVRLADEETSRQAFVSAASHELRTPLASLQATLELLREEAADGRASDATTVARSDTALRQTHRLIALANDLLDLSRVDGHAPLRDEPVELGALAATVGREFAHALTAEGRELVVLDRPRVVAAADPSAVVRILRILVDNARAYGAGTVTVATEAHDELVGVLVGDEGTGVAPHERERIFVRFARGEQGHEKPGSGLGLAIARGLAQEMGGDVELLDLPGGAQFRLRLPRGAAPEPGPVGPPPEASELPMSG